MGARGAGLTGGGAVTGAARSGPRPLRRGRARGAGAAAAVLVLLGTAALGPASVAGALAGAEAGPVAGEDRAVPGGAQSLDAASAPLSIVDTAVDAAAAPARAARPPAREALLSLEEFLFRGSVSWGGYRFTYYSQQVLPGSGLAIPGRHVNAGGYVSDGDGYIVLAGSAPKGTVFETPFGYPGKIYDRGTVGTHLDVYIR